MPYVLLAAVSVLIGVLMHLYSRASSRLAEPSRRADRPSAASAALLVVFWAALPDRRGLGVGRRSTSSASCSASSSSASSGPSRTTSTKRGRPGVCSDSSAAARAWAARWATASRGFFQEEIGENNLLLVAAAVLAVCMCDRHVDPAAAARSAPTVVAAVDERGVGGGEAIRLLRESRHLQIIALVIGLRRLRRDDRRTAAVSGGRSRVRQHVSEFLGRVGVYPVARRASSSRSA